MTYSRDLVASTVAAGFGLLLLLVPVRVLLILLMRLT
jgi:hypothetical protein